MSIRSSRSTFVLPLVLFTALLTTGCTGELRTGPPGAGDEPIVAVAAVDGQGSATPSPSDDVTVATVDTWTVTYEAGPGGISGGGAVRFTVPGLWSPPSLNPWAMGHVTVASSVEDVMLGLQVDNVEPDPGETHVDTMADLVTVGLAAGTLAEGDTVTLTYGDTDGGGEGALAPFGALEGMTFGVETDAQGDGSFGALASSPSVDMVPGPPAALRVVATRTLITAGEDVELDIHVEDQFGNKTTGFAGDLTIATTPESTAPATVAPTLTLQAADDDAGQTIYMGEEHTDPPFPHDHTYEAHIQGANDGETIRYWRLMWYDPTAAAGERWKVCKEVGPMIRYGFNAAIDIDDEECIATGTNIYYVEIEQALAIDEKFMVHLENKYIDFVVDGDATEYSAALYHWPGVKWYTAADLATEIADAMNTAYTPGCDPFSASYDTGTHEFTITNDEEDVFDLLWLSGDHGFWEDLDPNVGGSQDNAARLLGFNAIDDEDLSSYTSDFAIHSDGWSEREMA